MCPTKNCYAAHTLEAEHIWRTVICRTCRKLVAVQTPHPNHKGGNDNMWLTYCANCDVYGIYQQSPKEIDLLKR